MTKKQCAAQHFGLWMVEPQWFSQAVKAVKDGSFKPIETSVTKSIAADVVSDNDGNELYTRTPEGIAIVEIVGQVTKGVSSFGGASGVLIRKAIRKAREDPQVHTAIEYIDSPGGRADVPAAVVDELNAFKKSGKRLFAFIDGMACSAAYWMACPAERIYAGRTDMAGCIGAYSILYDDSGMQEAAGVKSVLVKTGRYKGLGADGKVTEDMIDDVQRELNEVMEPFLADIAAGRNMDLEKVRELADGRTHLGENAKALGLVDEITTYEAALLEIVKMTKEDFTTYAASHSEAVKELKQMGDKKFLASLPVVEEMLSEAKDEGRNSSKPKNATASELKAAFPNDPGFVMDRLDSDAPMADHKVAYADYLAKQLTNEKQAHDATKAKLAEIDPAHAGTTPVNTPTDKASGDKPLSPEREAELLNMSALGVSIAKRK